MAYPVMRYFSPDGEATFEIQDARTGKQNGLAINVNKSPAITYNGSFTYTVTNATQTRFLIDGGRCQIKITGVTKNNGVSVNSFMYEIEGSFIDDNQGGFIFESDESLINNISYITLTDNQDDTCDITVNLDSREVDSILLATFIILTYKSIQNTFDIDVLPIDDIYTEIVDRLISEGYIQSQM